MNTIPEIITELRGNGQTNACHLIALCDSHDQQAHEITRLRAELSATVARNVALEHGRKSASIEIDRLDAAQRSIRANLERLMPFVLEGYYAHCATPEFFEAVESAKATLGITALNE